ncbi:DUF6221 family protein [Pseudarthrobacter sp. LMD1-1-1.1]|uniref:DUF6221 family protein n=1 Tax=Pseudarthrobacter sp. LMD1-1-1.1 TaxID=3135242 RepID=UPI003435A6F4
MTIIEFLEARIAEDEAEARENQQYEDQVYETAGWWDCTRALAECAAKRAVIYEHGRDDSSTRDYCETCADWWKSELGEGPPGVAWPCPTLRAVAAVYSDHSDYQKEWARGE